MSETQPIILTKYTQEITKARSYEATQIERAKALFEPFELYVNEPHLVGIKHPDHGYHRTDVVVTASHTLIGGDTYPTLLRRHTHPKWSLLDEVAVLAKREFDNLAHRTRIGKDIDARIWSKEEAYSQVDDALFYHLEDIEDEEEHARYIEMAEYACSYLDDWDSIARSHLYDHFHNPPPARIQQDRALKHIEEHIRDIHDEFMWEGVGLVWPERVYLAHAAVQKIYQLTM